MQTLNYTEIQKIETSATNKLLEYISSMTEFKGLLEEIELFYPDFNPAQNQSALNIWLGVDLVGDDGRTFISQFLEERSDDLTKEEKEVLKERDKSNVSLFEIIDIDGNNIKVLDLLQQKSYDIWDSELVKSLDSGDIIFSRIGNLLGHTTFIGDLNYLPTESRDTFLKQTFIDFNHIRSHFPELTIKEYLKNYGLNLYSIYTDCMFEAMEMTEDITSNLYSELDEYEAYLQLNSSGETIRETITILIEFFEYYLADEDLTLYDLDKLDLNLFFIEAIEDGFISSKESFHSYIHTLKKYIEFLSHIDSDYKATYKSILDISQNRFQFMKYFNLVKPIFKIDAQFSDSIANLLNEEALSLLMDLDKFLLYVIDNPLELTQNNRHIKRKDLFEIRKFLETGDFPNKKAPNQKDFPVIHLFFKLATDLDILEIKDGSLYSTEKTTSYLRLRDKEKYTLLFQYIIGFEKVQKELVAILSSFDENKKYSMDIAIDSFSGKSEFLSKYYFYLQYLGILRCNLYPSYEIKLTSMGKSIIEFLNSRNRTLSKCSILSLEDYRNKQ